MSFHEKGYWRRMADPDATPASALVGLRPDTLGAYHRLCGRPDLPEELVDWMVEAALRDTCNVTHSSKVLHLLSRHSLPPRHLTHLASGMHEHEYSHRGFERLLTHPRAGRGVLAELCWAEGKAAPRGPADRDYFDGVLDAMGAQGDHGYLRGLLAEHDDFTRAGLVLADALRTLNQHRRGRRGRGGRGGVGGGAVSGSEFSALLRRLWLVGPAAVDVAARLSDRWTGTLDELGEAAGAVAHTPAI